MKRTTIASDIFPPVPQNSLPIATRNMADRPRNYSERRIDVDSANRVLVPPLVSSPTAISEINIPHNVFDRGFAGREGDEENNDFQINTTRNSTSRPDAQPDEPGIHADTVITEQVRTLPSEQAERTRPSERLSRYRMEMTYEEAAKFFEWRKEQDRETRTPATTETVPLKRGFSLKSLFSRRESKSPASQGVTKFARHPIRRRESTAVHEVGSLQCGKTKSCR